MNQFLPERPSQDDRYLRKIALQLDDIERRLGRLEARVDATTPSGWQCFDCKRGWVTETNGILHCSRCSVNRSL